MIGQLLDGRYKIVRALSSGTFGETYLAEDTKLPGNPTCVVKQLKQAISNPAILQIARRLFKKEAETLQKLGTHPQIPQLLADLECGGEFYLVQEYIAGHPLTQELVPDKPLPEEEVTGMLLELLEILDFVHDNKIIHRDISPKNIMRRDRDKKLFLIDFGAVKEVSSQLQNKTIMIGTPGYMPVEQIACNPDYKSDVYAVGMIAIEALTGKYPLNLPFAPATQEVIWRDRAQVSQKLGDILDKMVRRDCPQRYSTKEALQAVRNLKKPAGLPAFLWAVPVVLVLIIAPAVIKLLAGGKDSSSRLPVNGEAVSGVLTSADRSDNPLDSTFSKVYFFDGRGGERVRVEMESQEFDPYLVLRNADGKTVDYNDDISPQNFNAKIVTTLPADGTYTVIARSKEAGETGAYTLRVTSGTR